MAQIPSDIVALLKQFSGDLKEIENVVAEFVSMTPEQRNALTPLEKARRDVTAASLVNSLYCMHASTVGRDPNKEDMVGVEQRKIKEVDDRLDELERRPFRPVLNKRVAKSFIRNALSETTSADPSNSQMNEHLPNDASYAIVEQQEDEQDEDETDYEEENTYDLQDNF